MKKILVLIILVIGIVFFQFNKNSFNEAKKAIELLMNSFFVANSSFLIRHMDLLALDMNKDGVINTTTVQESETYFDLTGDGIKERTGWIKSEDVLLVYDKNEDGKVGGIDEVFGNVTTEGFDELRDIVDSNKV